MARAAFQRRAARGPVEFNALALVALNCAGAAIGADLAAAKLFRANEAAGAFPSRPAGLTKAWDLVTHRILTNMAGLAVRRIGTLALAAIDAASVGAAGVGCLLAAPLLAFAGPGLDAGSARRRPALELARKSAFFGIFAVTSRTTFGARADSSTRGAAHWRLPHDRPALANVTWDVARLASPFTSRVAAK